MHLDPKQKWYSHLKCITRKAERYLPVILSTLHNLYGYSCWARRIMYEATIGALFNYCSNLFYNSKIQKLICRLHRRATINTARLYRLSSHDAAALIACIIPLDLRATERGILWLVKHRMDVPAFRHLPQLSTEHTLYKEIKKEFREATIAHWQTR